TLPFGISRTTWYTRSKIFVLSIFTGYLNNGLVDLSPDLSFQVFLESVEQKLTFKPCIILVDRQGLQIKTVMLDVLVKLGNHFPYLVLNLIDIQTGNNLHVKLKCQLFDMLFGVVDDLRGQQEVVGNHHQIRILVRQHHIQQRYVGNFPFMFSYFYGVTQSELI